VLEYNIMCKFGETEIDFSGMGHLHSDTYHQKLNATATQPRRTKPLAAGLLCLWLSTPYVWALMLGMHGGTVRCSLLQSATYYRHTGT